MKINYGKMPFGLKNVSEYLGIEDDKAIFLHSMAFDSENMDRKKINCGKMIYAEIFSFACSEGPLFASSYYNQRLIDYLDDVQVINKNNLVTVGKDKSTDWPYNSVSKMLKKRLESDLELRKRLDGYTIVSSFLGRDDEDSAKLVNGKTLMNIQDQVKFNSKFYMRKYAFKHGFSVPRGECFCGLKNLNSAIVSLKKQQINKIWIKLESQTSGDGNIYVENIDNIDDIYNNVKEIASKIYDKNYIDNDLRLIVEEDLSDKEIINLGVEAVIGDNMVTILGSVAQKTDNAVYRGSYVSEDTIKYSKIAEEVAKDLFIAYSKEGYRGFFTVDVLVTNDNKAFCIDPNARFSAGSMLLKNIHSSEYYTGRKMYGLSFTNSIPKRNDLIDDIFYCIGDYLYKGKDSEYQGIIPALCNDIDPLSSGKYYLKSVVIADSYDKALKVYNEFKDRIKEIAMER